ncbi:MAG: YtxH domain-containing protein [Alphaproteobacteria bacterium]|nr:YtxH domain-containing protein [Alphaproteobacteria bacterium]
MNYPTTDDVLGSLGLMRKPVQQDWVTPAALFGAGLVTGAAAAALLTPRRGSEVRAEIADAARNVQSTVSTLAHEVANVMPTLHRYDAEAIEAK